MLPSNGRSFGITLIYKEITLRRSQIINKAFIHFHFISGYSHRQPSTDEPLRININILGQMPDDPSRAPSSSLRLSISLSVVNEPVIFQEELSAVPSSIGWAD